MRNKSKYLKLLIRKQLHEKLAEDMAYNFGYNFPSAAMLNVLGRVYVVQNRVRHYVETELRHE